MKIFYLHINREVVSKKAKEQISKRVLQENKGRQIFQKNEHLLPRYAHEVILVLASSDSPILSH